MSRRTTIAPGAIVFDFDLTLADSRPGFVAAHHFTTQALGLPTPSRDAIARSIGTPLEKIVPRWFPGLDDAAASEYIRVYRKQADEVMESLTTMLPGAREAVQRLGEAGMPLAIVSQKLRHLITSVLERDGIVGCFDHILGGQDVPAFKPEPGGLLLALERLDVAPSDGLYVGDTTIDAEAASRGGIPFVGVLSGVTTRDEFAPYKAQAVLTSVVELPDYLEL